MATFCAQCDTIVLNYKLGPLRYIYNGVYVCVSEDVTIREYTGFSELNSSAALAGCAFCKLIWRLAHDRSIKAGLEKEQFSRIICSFSQIGSGLKVIFEDGAGSFYYEYLEDIYTEEGSDQ